MIAPLIIALMNRYPNIRVTVMWAGIIIGVLCLISSSFATRTWHLVLGEGVGYGIGGAFAYYPTVSPIYLGMNLTRMCRSRSWLSGLSRGVALLMVSSTVVFILI